MPYFVMTCNGVYPSAAIARGPGLSGVPWYQGRPITESVSEPLVYIVDAEQPGNIPAMLDDMAQPLMRDDLVNALQAVGVDNLQLFAAVVEDPTTGIKHTNYKAFNVLGMVAAADMSRSVRMATSDSTLIDVDFESLAIDEKKAAPFRLFRLAENVSTIIVDEAVKGEVERREIPGMQFYDPADWSG
jgi:hypothetical protein